MLWINQVIWLKHSRRQLIYKKFRKVFFFFLISFIYLCYRITVLVKVLFCLILNNLKKFVWFFFFCYKFHSLSFLKWNQKNIKHLLLSLSVNFAFFNIFFIILNSLIFYFQNHTKIYCVAAIKVFSAFALFLPFICKFFRILFRFFFFFEKLELLNTRLTH